MHQALSQKTLDALNRQQFGTARKHALRGIKQFPQRPEFPNFAGIALGALGKQKEAAAQFQKALKIAPTYADARRNLAQTLVLLDQPATALEHLAKLLDTAPGDAAALYLKAQAHLAAGDAGAALTAIDTVITRAAPGVPRDLSLRARIHNALGDEASALRDHEAILAIDPNRVETLIAVSQPLARAGRADEADTAIRKAVELAPDNPEVLLRFAAHLEESGEKDQAVEVLRTILARDPSQPLALEHLARLAPGTDTDQRASAARKALRATSNPSLQRASLNFALAHLCKPGEDLEGFAKNLAQANANMAALYPHNSAFDARMTDALIARCPKGTPTAADDPGADPRPVFVVGLPRSGTTLTERVLAGNTNVWPLGELNTAGRLLAPVINNDLPFDLAAQKRLREDYAADLPAASQRAVARVDKMPENYQLVGFLLTALPGCRIINLLRDPRDIALSLWQARFAGTALSYTYDLQAMAARFNQYARLMAHWTDVFGRRILHLRYEDLVGDVDAASRELADFCDLDWVPQMATPHANSGSVLTLSAAQVRQPVHSRSVGGWTRHAEMLAPFIDGLDPVLWP